MPEEKQQVHRPGAFKQVNKAHNTGRHRSKGAINAETKGKASVKVITKKKKEELNKRQRRHQAVQLRKNKTEETLSQKRAIGGLGHPPFLVCVLPLQASVDPATALSILTQCDSEATVNQSPTGVTHISIPRFKQRFSFVIPDLDNEFSILDTLKVADTVLFILSATDEEPIDKVGRNLLDLAFAQGFPSTVIAVTDLEGLHPKKRNEEKQSIQKQLNKYFNDEKIMPLDKYADALNILRKIGTQKRKTVPFRDNRPHLFAEQILFEENANDECGTLKVTGFLKGTDLSVNSLVHIPGLGDFQMAQIDEPYDPYPLDPKKEKPPPVTPDGKIAVTVLDKADPTKQESLVSENIPDEMDAEQTWPTQEELDLAKEEQKSKKMKVPTGCSDYQAMWHEAVEDDDCEDEEMLEEDSESEGSDGEEMMDDDESEAPVNEDKYDKDMDLDTEKADLEKVKAAKVDFQFPDEIDTPLDQTARVRFQKYKFLESFKKSNWDPLENLPQDYARIYQLPNFKAAKVLANKMLKDMEPSASPGMYITVHVKNVLKTAWNLFQSAKPVVTLIGLLPFEHKMSAVNARLKRTKNYDMPIRSKDRLVVMCGYRRYIVNPIFSQHTNNGKKFKFERYFQQDTVSVATFYAPIQFPPAPVLCFKEANKKLALVAKGELLSCSPKRIVLKRVVLTGYPFKVHKSSAVIRFMFFNPEDVNYFKVCDLKTKEGRKGKIKEPMGTHGHMKCYFNKPIKSHDTVMLVLYKRVFPKWTYENLIVSADVTNNN